MANLINSLWFDLRTAVRFLSKNRGSSLLAVLSIALGIGVTTTLFSVADAVLFRPFAFVRPEEVYDVTSFADDNHPISYGWRDYEDLVQAAGNAGEAIAVNRCGATLAGELGGELVMTYVTTPNFFAMLGARAEFGLASLAASGDGRPQAVLGHRLWMRRFGGDRGIVGQTVVLNQRPFVVAGVMPASFTGVMRGVPCDVWMSTDAWFAGLNATAAQRERQSRNGQFDVYVRLRPGVAPEALAARLDAVLRGEGAHQPAPPGVPGTVLANPFYIGWKERLVIGGGLLPVFGLLLLVACANAAQLRLAQAESRRKEMGVRLALGSSPWRIARMLLVETMVVSAAGAAVGLWLADAAMGFVAATVTSVMPMFDLGVRLDWRVGAFVLTATLLSSMLAGLAPARHALRLDVLDILKSGEGTMRAKHRLQRALIAGQTAASVVFFGLALLFSESFRHAAAIWPGFDPSRPMVLLSVAPSLRIPRTTWCEQAGEKLRGVPGVRDVTFARRLPLSGSGGGYRVRVEIPEQPPLAAAVNTVAPNYFSVMRVRVLAGRGIGAEDRQGGALVAVISRGLAEKVAGAGGPIGREVTIEGESRQIVGIVEDAPSNGLHEAPEPFVYLPYTQFPRGDLTLMVDAAADPASLLRPIQRELKKFDAGVTTYDVHTLRQHMDQALFADRTAAVMTTGLGALGFALTAAGLFGIVQYSVHRRTREIGVRIALGAAPRVIQRAVLRESVWMIAPGIAIGLALLGGGSWALRSVLLAVDLLNPETYIVCAVAAVVVAVLAAWLPARRATRINPVEALRAE